MSIDSSEIISALQAAGIIPEKARVRRVVVDLQVGCEPIIHVEMIGSRKTIELVQYLDGVVVATEFKATPRMWARPEARSEADA